MANPGSRYAILLANQRARVVSYGLVFCLAVASEWGRGRAPGFWISLIAIVVAWPPLAYAIARGARDLRVAEVRNILLDTAGAALFAASLAFPILPTVALPV